MDEIIDIHNHVISSDTARYPLAPAGGKQSDWSRARPASAQALIAAMDEAGVAKSAVVHASTAYGFDNSYLADSVKANPSRFTGEHDNDEAFELFRNAKVNVKETNPKYPITHEKSMVVDGKQHKSGAGGLARRS